MRKLLIASLVLVGGSMLFSGVKPAAASEYPWCAQYTGSHSGMNCGFVSQRQCLAATHGVGGFCRQNPYFLAYYGYYR